jgi:hypothetical protein
LDASLEARIRKALAECADAARSDVILKHFKNRGPTHEECDEEVAKDHRGEPITRAMQLGVEQHQIALECTQQQLEQLKPGGFTLKPRYRYNPRTGRTEYIPADEVKTLLRQGRSAELRGTLEPDIVVHTGDPRQVQSVYDFKFPCVNGGEPAWRKYPEGHAHQYRNQGELYTEALGVVPLRVIPRRGVIR